ncbi:MAG: glycosyltransferase family 2 protein [Gordonia sp. (in: high G+C Gram-positive bacteria)]
MSSETVTDTSLCVVICCYSDERWDLLVRAIDAAAEQLVVQDRLIVVVDHNDALRARLQAHISGGSAPVAIVASTGRPGLSGARNTGMELSGEDVLVYLDDDAVVAPGALDAVRAGMHPDDVVCLGGAVRADWEGGAPSWFPEEFGWVVGCDYRGMPADGSSIRNPIGAAMAVRREPLAAVGGFHAALGRQGAVPAGCEETLMGIELTRADPDSQIVRHTGFAVEHHVPLSRQNVTYFLSRCLHEGRSKATLSALAGTSSALSAEITYLTRTITSAVLRYLGQVVRGDVSALARLLLMLAGVATTAAGTVGGTVRRMFGRSSASKTTTPGDAQDPPRRAPVTPDAFASVVVATVGRPSLVTTVKAVLAQDHPDFELIVVDNRPATGRTREVLAGVDDPRLRIVDEPLPGISAARNRGIAEIRGAVAAFTDDDAIPDPDWLSRIVRSFADDATGTLGLVTGRVLATEELTEVQAWFEEAKIFDKGDTAKVWALADRPQLQNLGVPGERTAFFPYTAGQFGSGNNMAFAAETLDAVGGFDLRLGTGTKTRGGEDLDLFRTVVLEGWSVFYDPEAVVRHYHRDNLDDLRDQWYGYGTGLAASLTKLLATGHALAVVRCLGPGLALLLHPSSERNQSFPEDWPRELKRIELSGMLAGPVLFVRSHWTHRRNLRAK